MYIREKKRAAKIVKIAMVFFSYVKEEIKCTYRYVYLHKKLTVVCVVAYQLLDIRT